METPIGSSPVVVIGAGLAGSEAAWQLAAADVPVVLYEMRPVRGTPAHRTDRFAELVCSNTLRSDDPTNAIGCLKEEMRALGSLVISAADAHRVPAGKALAVDREGFSRHITDRLAEHPRVRILREEVPLLRPLLERDLTVIVATGPLTSDSLACDILDLTHTNALYFYDSLAPLVAAETVDMSKTFRASRYGMGDGDDYINCPMTRPEYDAFVQAVIAAEQVPVRDFEDPKYFEGCLPIEVMAERGIDTLRHGPMKPMGLADPRAGAMPPHAVVQLRQDNAAGTVYNMVGFQTRMKWPEQLRILRMIPGLERAEFLRLGAMHRNTYINAPLLLDEHLHFKTLLRRDPYAGLKPREGAPPSKLGQIVHQRSVLPVATGDRLHLAPPGLRPAPPPQAPLRDHPSEGFEMNGLYFAGQIVGVEGYVESAAMGLWVGLCVGTRAGKIVPPPQTTALGSLINHVAHGNPSHFEPQNAHWGLTPALASAGGKAGRKAVFLARARDDFAAWLTQIGSDNKSVAIRRDAG